MEQLASDLWIVDGPSVPFLGLPFSTRMTVIRLADGALWIHSPIPLTQVISEQLAEIGHVRFLIAPNSLHHLFITEWLAAYPNAKLYGTDEVIRKRSDLSFTASFNDENCWPWQNEIDQLLFTGSPLMQECVFFHKASKTLLVTDLVENFSSAQFNWWQYPLAKIAGVLAPNGQTPIDWRLSFVFGKKSARLHFDTMLAWQPQTLVMAHGEIVTTEVNEFLCHSFRWL